MYKLENLNNKKVVDLKKIAEELSIPKSDKLKKLDLIYAILDHQAESIPKPIKKEYKIIYT